MYHLLPELKYIFEKHYHNSKQKVHIYVGDVTEFLEGLIQDVNFPFVVIDYSGEIDTIEGENVSGAYTQRLNIKGVIGVQNFGVDRDVVYFGSDTTWGLTELTEDVRTLFYKNKTIRKQDMSIDRYITNGQMPASFKYTKSINLINDDFNYVYADFSIDYFRFRPLEPEFDNKNSYKRRI